MSRKTHKQRVDEQQARYEAQLDPGAPPNERDEARRIEQRARAEEKAAAAAEVRRQKAIGEALDLQAQLDAARGGKLVLPAAIAQGDLTRVSMVLWLQNVMVLTDRGQNAPNVKDQITAADLAAQRVEGMLRLVAESQGVIGGAPAQVVESKSPTEGLTREEKIALAREHLKIVRGT